MVVVVVVCVCVCVGWGGGDKGSVERRKVKPGRAALSVIGRVITAKPVTRTVMMDCSRASLGKISFCASYIETFKDEKFDIDILDDISSNI